jgi:hypothetical protein
MRELSVLVPVGATATSLKASVILAAEGADCRG